MSDSIVMLHGSATGAMSWKPIAESLVADGARVFAPDLLGYGHASAPSAAGRW
jgi:pimeloyl-ACP methyl ester carboxylesterase